jgi:hypothetical protein
MINLTIQKEDIGENDFIVSWNLFGSRPNKLSYYRHIDLDKFNSFLSEYKLMNMGSTTEIFEDITNIKYLFKLSEGISLSFIRHLSESEGEVVGEFQFYYKDESSDQILKIVEQLNILSESDSKSGDKTTKEGSLFTLLLSNQQESPLTEIPLIPLEIDDSNLAYYYEDSILSSFENLKQKIDNRAKGISIIYGPRGVGKTHMITSLCRRLSKNCYFIPINMCESVFTNPEFRKFFYENTNSVFVMDDSEIVVSKSIYDRSTSLINSIIQIVDGMESNLFNSHIILCVNSKNLSDIDDSIVGSNNIMDIINVTHLSKEKTKNLLDKIGKVSDPNQDGMRLIDILSNENKKILFSKDFGYN